MAKSMVARVAELQEMSQESLRKKWSALFDSSPPATLSRQQMVGRLAYRLQELVFGGLPVEMRQKLEALGASPTAQVKAGARAPGKLIPGTRLVREWQGTNQEVTVLASGFAYAGKTYTSLSAIATEITGTKWNGPEFFGLRRRVAADNSANAQSARGKTK